MAHRSTLELQSTPHASGDDLFAKLPDEVLLQVFSWCNGDDLQAFSKVNHKFRAVCCDGYLWRLLFRRRFNRNPAGNAASYQEEYYSSDQFILNISEECDIAHYHHPYWMQADDPRSMFGQIAMLNAVSWLHVSGTLRGVPTGTYNVIWRLFVVPRAQHIFDINFRAETTSRHIAEAHLPRSDSLLEFGSDYFDFVIPRRLVISEPFEDVLVECESTSLEWKTNLALCSVRLEPLDKRLSTRKHRWADFVNLPSAQKRSDRPGRIRNLRSRPGVAYRPWKPWTVSRWYETAVITAFSIIAIAIFTQLLLKHTE